MEIQLWREMLDPYAQAVSELVTKFSNLRQEYRNRGIYCPIESISGRVKSVSSILEKMHRKEIPFDRMENRISGTQRPLVLSFRKTFHGPAASGFSFPPEGTRL